MEEHAAQPGPDGLDPQAAIEQRLRQLEEEAKKLREALGGSSAPAPDQPIPAADSGVPAGDEPEEEEEEEIDLTPLTAEVQGKVENLIRRARIEGQRGEKQLAEKLLQEAAALAPNSPDVLEMVADGLAMRGKRKDAEKLYKRAFRISKSPTHERKWGMMIAATDWSATELAERMNQSDSVANPKVAVILSLAIPWLGQIVLGEYVKGGVLLGLYGLMWALAFSVPNGIPSLLALMGVNTGSSGSNLNIFVMLPLAAAAIIHLGGLFDAVTKAKKFERREIGRPEPPVNLPFD